MSKVQITFAFDTISEAVSFMAKNTEQGKVLLAPAAADPKPAAAAMPAAIAKRSVATAPTAAPAPPPAAAEGIEYAVLQKAVFALAGKGDEAKAAAKAIAGTFGVAKFTELPADKRQAALDLVNAKIAELDDTVA